MTRFTPLLTAAALLGLILIQGCGGAAGNLPVEGRVTYDGDGVIGARVEVYLDEGRFRRTTPFAEAYTDETGAFLFELPRGEYYLVARAEVESGERLFGEFPSNPVRIRGKGSPGGLEIPLGSALSAMEYRGPADSGIEGYAVMGDRSVLGSSTYLDRPAAGSFVYVYERGEGDLVGPGYLTARAVDEEGYFRIGLHPGRYRVAVRMKVGGGKAGYVGTGDYSGYPENPVTVGEGRFTDLGGIPLHPVDAARLTEMEEQRRRPPGETGLAGVVLGPEGEPIPGLFVLLYDHPQMIGRPLVLVSSGEGGAFRMAVDEGGDYYLGARQSRSGPRSPGEMAGGYEGSPDHSIGVEEGKWLEGVVIRVEEVW